jgi:hypothetical protein
VTKTVHQAYTAIFFKRDVYVSGDTSINDRIGDVAQAALFVRVDRASSPLARSIPSLVARADGRCSQNGFQIAAPCAEKCARLCARRSYVAQPNRSTNLRRA